MAPELGRGRAGRPGSTTSPGAHVVERRPHLLERDADELGPREPVDRELERVGLVRRGWSSSRRRGSRPSGPRRRPRRSGRAPPGRRAPARTAPRRRAAPGRRTGRVSKAAISSVQVAVASRCRHRPGRAGRRGRSRSCCPKRASTQAWNRVPNRAAGDGCRGIGRARSRANASGSSRSRRQRGRGQAASAAAPR